MTRTRRGRPVREGPACGASGRVTLVDHPGEDANKRKYRTLLEMNRFACRRALNDNSAGEVADASLIDRAGKGKASGT